MSARSLTEVWDVRAVPNGVEFRHTLSTGVVFAYYHNVAIAHRSLTDPASGYERSRVAAYGPTLSLEEVRELLAVMNTPAAS